VSKQTDQLHRDRHAVRRINEQVFWTNPSVNAFSGDEDPIAVMPKKRDLVFKAIEDGWQDSPLDPFWFAEYRQVAIDLTIRNRLKISKSDYSDEARKFRTMICEEQPHRKRSL
jgi:hypothetical protein